MPCAELALGRTAKRSLHGASPTRAAEGPPPVGRPGSLQVGGFERVLAMVDHSPSRRMSLAQSGGDLTPTQSFARMSIHSCSSAGGASADSEHNVRHGLQAESFQKVIQFVNSGVFSSLMTCLTVFVLVGDDFRLIFTEASSDYIFNWLTAGCLLLFTMEMVLYSLAKEAYIFSFWFFCDLFATGSLILDFTFVADVVMNVQDDIDFDSSVQLRGGGADKADYARATRSGRVGARVVRFLRLARLVRLTKIVRVFIGYLTFRSEQKRHSQHGENQDELSRAESESRVGKKLSEKTTERVILLVLAMLLIVPVLEVRDDEAMMETSAQYGADSIFEAWRSFELGLHADSAGKSIVNNSQRLRDVRLNWENDVLRYLYYHGEHQCASTLNCSSGSLLTLAWIGHVLNPNQAVASKRDTLQDAFIKLANINELHYDYHTGVWAVPSWIREVLSKPWTTPCENFGGQRDLFGASLIPGMPCPHLTFRPQEIMWYMPFVGDTDFVDNYMSSQFVFIFDSRKVVKFSAVMNIGETFFIALVLALGALLFSRDVDNLVLVPIERMIGQIEVIRRNPLHAVKLGEQQREAEEKKGDRQRALAGRRKSVVGRRGQNISRDSQRLLSQSRLKKPSMETAVLENTIIKLGSLLALGFGEAGSEIIGRNLDDENASVSTMTGSKVEAIYGFAEIRDFATVTSVLQEKTMVFVNQVAEIVHRIVDGHLGAANKNVGEAFLLVWRTHLYADNVSRSRIADLAVLSFVQCVAELNSNKRLADYRQHPALLGMLPNFRVSCSFGLHLGWAIEGAVGSDLKIDASYVSPHVNLASQLSSSTALFGVFILISQPLTLSCNPEFRKNFRPVDHVLLEGSKTPMRLFTVDLDSYVVQVDTACLDMRKHFHRRFRDDLKNRIFASDFNASNMLKSDRLLAQMRRSFTGDFFQSYTTGYLNYEAGEWEVAEKVLRRTRLMLRRFGKGDQIIEDVPSTKLLEYMSRWEYRAPASWKGWHVFDEARSTTEMVREETFWV
eukprot:TRINITY_DN12237_c0_g3_i1.p1 TRINITY_DN12237_c0_g3~~TRINITY_DN12237_c0_g3_i1.p1  ORF type:complete len:1015 (+),score=183.25 TRINITY_DN12237_c0_g3_i1:92-3136(+)